MKKFLLTMITVCLLASLPGCGSESPQNELFQEETMPTEQYSGIIPNSVEAGSAEDIAVRETVAEYLDTFISCDFDAVQSALHTDDRWLFNFESEDQKAFYSAIFPKIKYQFEFVSEYEGVYGVMTEITSPDMAEVYGTIIANYIDSATSQDKLGVEDIMSNSTEVMIDMINSPDLKKRCERLYIYVEHINGEYIPRCDAFLANELTGGAPEVSDELSSTLYNTVDALNE